MSNEHLGRRALVTLLALNGVMFVVEVASGWQAESMGLIADGLDMGADAAVYLLALLAIGATAARKLSAARFAGRVQLALAVLAILELGRRAIVGSAPEPPTMVGVSLIALAVNVACLALLRRHRHGEVHLQAAWIFSATDVQANLGVLLAAALVAVLESPVPDLVVGLVVCGLVLRGALRIARRVRDAEAQARASGLARAE
ncbi:MAG: cation transporter [Gemmatimonadaceae bacterium]|nr:cation transporter [Gemmatimonadaceae bacterium]